MAKKHTKNEQTSDEKTELTADEVAEMSVDVMEIAEKLKQIAEKMKSRHIASISARGIPTWRDAFRRLRGSTGSIDRAWLERSSLRKTVAEKREKFESGGSE